MNLNDFLEITPKELNKIIEYKQELNKNKYENYHILLYDAVGQLLGGKKYKGLFNRNEKKTNEIDIKERKKVLDHFNI